jgi:2-polyprenyl-6-methoxyphenol hydroxylase-like FAD-dependent oxidoreductase
MNVGLHEAEDLAGKLKKILRDHASPRLLEDYGRDHRAQWEQLLGRTEGLMPGTSANPWVKTRSPRILSCLPASGGDLTRLIDQLGSESQSVGASSRP